MAAVLEFFSKQGIPVASLDESTFITHYQGDNGHWRCFGAADDEAQTFVFYSEPDVEVAAERVGAVVEYLMRATAGLVVGNFEFDFDTRGVVFKTSIDVESDRLTPALVANVVVANVVVVDRYLPGLQQVAAGTAEPGEAVALAEGS